MVEINKRNIMIEEKYSEEFIKECEDVDEYPLPEWWDPNLN